MTTGKQKKVTDDDQDLGAGLEQFWELEHLDILDAESSEPDFHEAYAKTITRSEDGRYRVYLPWKAILNQNLKNLLRVVAELYMEQIHVLLVFWQIGPTR